MSRFIGIDFGDQRTGFAVSDVDGTFAFPQSVVSSEWIAIKKEIEALISNGNSEGIVIGLPQNFSGEDTLQTKKVRLFGECVRKEFNAPVFFSSELLTTKSVEKNNAARADMIDASSAALILQQFLDMRRSS